MQVSKAKIHVEEQPWKRVHVDGTPHQHGNLACFCSSVLEAQLPKLYDRAVDSLLCTCPLRHMMLHAGFAMTGTEIRTTDVTVNDKDKVEVASGRHNSCSACSGQCCRALACIAATHAGVKNFRVLKTTQSGYEGFLHDKYTLLPDSSDRILATAITSTWK